MQTGIQIGTQLSEDNPHESSPIEGYTRQMHKLFMSIPNHDLEEWQLVRPMRFFLVTSDQQARDKVFSRTMPTCIVSPWVTMRLLDVLFFIFRSGIHLLETCSFRWYCL